MILQAGGLYGLNCVPPNPHIEALTPSVTVFGGRVFKGAIKVKWALIQLDSCPYNKRKRHWSSLSPHPPEERPCEGSVRKQLPASQKERKTTTLPAPWPWTSSLQNCEKVNLCCLIQGPSHQPPLDHYRWHWVFASLFLTGHGTTTTTSLQLTSPFRSPIWTSKESKFMSLFALWHPIFGIVMEATGG